MSFYELSAPRRPVISRFFTRIGHGIASGVRAMQYARMVQALSELSDVNLATIGISRADISRHARECVYGIGE